VIASVLEVIVSCCHNSMSFMVDTNETSQTGYDLPGSGCGPSQKLLLESTLRHNSFPNVFFPDLEN
jgi:hypothetical protein